MRLQDADKRNENEEEMIWLLRRILVSLERIERDLRPKVVMTPGNLAITVKG
jgi:hypothetical protein